MIKLKNPKFLIYILFFTFLFYLPILLDPSKLLGRNNDLNQAFWPVYYYSRENFVNFHSLPLWNTIFLSGTPLATDPQFSFYYPINWFFIIFRTDLAFVIYFLLHSYLAGVGMYMLSGGSLYAAAAYIFMPKFAGFITAGHYGLVASHTWIVWLAFFAQKLSIKPNMKNSFLVSLTLSNIFFTHTIIFLLSAFILGIYYVISLIKDNKQKLSLLKYYLLTGLMTLGLTSGSLLPQLAWAPNSTRSLLFTNPEGYPIWNGFRDYLMHLALPLPSPDTEKLIYLGILISFLALLSLRKLWIGIVALIVFTISANNLVGLDKNHLMVLLRVATRIWFVPMIIAILLADKTLRRFSNHKKTVIIIRSLALLEILVYSWSILNVKVVTVPWRSDNFINEITDKNKIYRVFCVDRCISQKQAAEHDFELISGYNTLIQMNYFKHSWQLMGGYWNYYTLSLPPYGAIKYNEVVPDSKSLGEYNTKYIISPRTIEDPHLALKTEADNYHIYENLKYLSRAYGAESEKEKEIIYYSPNKIIVKNTNMENIILAQTYSPGWRAINNNGVELEVGQTPQALNKITLQEESEYVTIFYDPPYYRAGKYISLTSYGLIIFYFIYVQKNKKVLHK